LHYATKANWKLMVVLMQHFSPQNQKGVVMIVTLAIMLVVTLLVISSVHATNIQILMSRNVKDERVAFQAAEAGLNVAESFLSAETSLAEYQANSSGKYVQRATGESDRWREDVTWQAANSLEAAYNDSVDPPRYIIEFVGTVVSEEDWLNMDNVGGGVGAGRTQMFKVTALGTGKTATATSVIQSTFGRRF
jgi:type IV pilus assembly protein PilX